MQDMTVTILTSFVGGTLIAAHCLRPILPNSYVRLAGKVIFLTYAAAVLGFYGFVLMGGSLQLDVSPVVAGMLKLLGLSLCLVGAWLAYQHLVPRKAPLDLTPPAHPSRTPPAP